MCVDVDVTNNEENGCSGELRLLDKYQEVKDVIMCMDTKWDFACLPLQPSHIHMTVSRLLQSGRY